MTRYISITDLCNVYYNDRAFSIFCKHHGDNLLNRLNSEKETKRCIYDSSLLTMNKGNSFEKNVCDFIKNKYSDIKIDEFDSWDSCSKEKRKKMRTKMKWLINQQVPIIFQAYLWDKDLRIHGYADLMLRNDIVFELFENLPAKFINLHRKSQKEKKYFYVIIDVKCKNMKVGNNTDFHIRDGKSDHEDYCFQVTAYYNMLNKIIKQTNSELIIPDFSCILGLNICYEVKGNVQKTKNCFEAMAFVYHDSKKKDEKKRKLKDYNYNMYTYLTDKIIENANLIDDVIENGNNWEITDDEFQSFFPKKKKDYFPWNIVGKRIMSILDKSEYDDNETFKKKLLIRKADQVKLLNADITFYFDIEFLDPYYVNDFRNFPKTYGFSCPYMLGLTLIDKNNNLIEKKQFIMKDVTKEERYIVCKNFSNYIEQKTNNYTNNYLFMHWSHAEKTQLKKVRNEDPKLNELSFFKRLDDMIKNERFFDLELMFKGSKYLKIPKIKLPTKIGTSIKPVLKLCKKYGLTKLDWEDNDMDGFNTIAASLMYYNNPIDNAYIMDIISRYNFIDCDAMWELRNILLEHNQLNVE